MYCLFSTDGTWIHVRYHDTDSTDRFETSSKVPLNFSIGFYQLHFGDCSYQLLTHSMVEPFHSLLKSTVFAKPAIG